MNSWKDQPVLIVGGDIGGLTAALALARQGIPSQLIEQAAAYSGAADEDLMAQRIANQQATLDRLTKQRDELVQAQPNAKPKPKARKSK